VKRAAAALLAALALACGPIPGGGLGGEPTPVPDDWTTALEGEKRLCEIESRSADPHSIQLECFLYEHQLHVQSHRWALASWWPVESWAAIWIAEPEVRVRIGGRLYDLRALQVTDAAQRAAVLGFRGYSPVPDGIAVFRFEPRAPGESADHVGE
jgi:hypothetical protein